MARRRKKPYAIEYSPLCREHLMALGAGERSIVLAEVDELRIGALRVYYEVDEVRRVVEIRAVGIKDRGQVIIGGEEIDLS